MRLRNIKGAKETVLKSSYVIENPNLYYGNWEACFSNQNPIHVEIGMGKGRFIIENAIRYPNINFVGIEKYNSVLVKAIQQLEGKNLPNLKIISMDAKEIEQIFNQEIDTIYLNFSDPWPKKRHAKRRLTSTDFLEKYEQIFKNKKHIIIKTDNRNLFEYSITSCSCFGYHIKEISLDLYQEGRNDNIPTEYEIKFSNKGYPIYRMEIEK